MRRRITDVHDAHIGYDDDHRDTDVSFPCRLLLLHGGVRRYFLPITPALTAMDVAIARWALVSSEEVVAMHCMPTYVRMTSSRWPSVLPTTTSHT